MDLTAKEKILSIIQKAANAELSRDELYNEWNEEWDSNEYFVEVFNNLESAVEHIPGYFLKQGINREAWENMKEYRLLKIDSELITSMTDLDSNTLLYQRSRKYKEIS